MALMKVNRAHQTRFGWSTGGKSKLREGEAEGSVNLV